MIHRPTPNEPGLWPGPDPSDTTTWRATLASRVHMPEQRLMIAVVESAMLDLESRGRDDHGHSLSRAAQAWFESTDREWPYSFEAICDTLGLAADRIRTQLLAGRQRLSAEERAARARRQHHKARLVDAAPTLSLEGRTGPTPKWLRVLNVLASHGPLAVPAIAPHAGLTPGEVSEAITRLRTRGHVRVVRPGVFAVDGSSRGGD